MASAAAAAAATARKNYAGGDQRCHLQKDEASFAHYVVCGVSFVVNNNYRPVQAIGTGAYGLVWFAATHVQWKKEKQLKKTVSQQQFGGQNSRGWKQAQRGHQEGVAHVREHHRRDAAAA